MLRELDKKLKFLNLQNFNEYRSVYDVHDVLVKLKLKVRTLNHHYKNAIIVQHVYFVGKFFNFRFCIL